MAVSCLFVVMDLQSAAAAASIAYLTDTARFATSPMPAARAAQVLRCRQLQQSMYACITHTRATLPLQQETVDAPSSCICHLCSTVGPVYSRRSAWL